MQHVRGETRFTSRARWAGPATAALSPARRAGWLVAVLVAAGLAGCEARELGGAVEPAAPPAKPVEPPPTAVLGLVPLAKAAPVIPEGPGEFALAEADTVEIRYGLGRSANALVLHWREGRAGNVVHEGKLGPAFSGLGTIARPGGNLGYAFAGEPGVHVFALVVSTMPVMSADALALFDKGWMKEPPAALVKWVRGVAVGVHVVRVTIGDVERL
jgi:hypothetical protein